MRLLAVLLLAAGAAPAETRIEIGDWLVVAPVDGRTRHPFNRNALLARYVLPRDAPPPRAGDSVRGSNGQEKWKPAELDDQGRVRGRIGLAYTPVRCDADRVVLARAPGAAVLFVNGDGFVGDVYGGGHPGVPVALRRGVNHVYVRGVRGRFALDLRAADGALVLGRSDRTVPHSAPGAPTGLAVSVPVLNASTAWRRPLVSNGREDAAGLAPLAARRIRARFRDGEARSRAIRAEAGGAVARTEVSFPEADADGPRRVTFVSRIDRSVQQYSVLAPRRREGAGLVLTLHGAGVDALGQVRSYRRKDDLWIVAPTNRRPFGFDWQDWGRIDAYEVRAHALAWTGADPSRVYLTGHSMGGHGAWHLAANDPDGFAAVAPSAGWCSFETYVGGPEETERVELWRAADRASDTRALIGNLAQVPAFILHGEDDDNVPASEARLMEEALRAAGAAPETHFAPGKKHWWNGPRSEGVDCVDFPGIFALFGRTRRARDPDRIGFATADPAVDSRHHWVEILQPLRYGRLARIRAERGAGGVVVRTGNVRRFGVTPGAGDGRRRFVVDGQVLHAPADARFRNTALGWTVDAPSPEEKRPDRSGPFKRAFDRGFVLVVGANDAEALARARYDAQAWWYRANGDAPIVTDETYLDDGVFAGRHAILYGNADTNRAFARLLPRACPVRVRAGRIELGGRGWTGPDLGCVFVYPMRGDPDGLVGVFGHTGAAGARAGYGLLPFVSGVGYPDYAVFGADFLTKGDGGVRAAGFFDARWRLPG